MFLSTEVHAGTSADTSSEEIERRHATTRAFQIRARRRTTPQGVFAAVADLEFTDDATTDLAVGDISTRSYPNPAWLHQVLERAFGSPSVLRGATFTANNLTARRGDRLEVELPSDHLGTGPQRISIQATEAVDVILHTCRNPVAWHQVAAALARKRPAVPDDAVDSVLRTMTRNGFLLTDLTPGDACNDPIGHILATFPITEPLRTDMSRLREALVEADTHPPGDPARMAALQTARQITDGIAPTWRPLAVDCACDAPIRISKDIAEQAAAAAGVLWRVAPGQDRLTDWHRRFLHRYGAQRLVPLMEACDPVTGLGCDAADPDQPPQVEATGVLARLLHDALTSGRLEVHLDSATIAALDRREPGDRPEPTAELYARVVAPGADRQDGKFLLALSDIAAPAGATRTRFTGLLTGAPAEGDTGQGTMTAELEVQPLSHAAKALTGRAAGMPWRIPIGVIPRPGDLLLHELAVVSNGRHLSLWSTRHQRPVRPVHRSRLGHHLMPPLAGFLCLLGQHGLTRLSPWTWKPFDGAPFLPRVRWHDTILAPARWRLSQELRQAARDRTGWEKALHDWRTRTRPAAPSTVVVDYIDRQLPLDLDRRDDCELLRRYLARGVDSVTEPPGGADAVQAVVPGPTGYHCLEIVVPLSADAEPEPAAAPPTPIRARGAGQGLVLPGGDWLSLTIDALPSTQDQVLERIVTAAHDTAELWDEWFWLRYHTPERGPHLRARFHGEPTVLGGQLLPVLQQTCAHAMTEHLSRGFAVEPYDPEIERYGGHEAIKAAEAIFHRDSELVAAILSATADPDERLALTAVSAAEITHIVADSDRLALAPFQLQRADRRVQARIRPACRALDDASPPHNLLWEPRASALKDYRDLLPPPRRIDCASSLIHMHANRMLGNNHHERIARALAADLIARKAP